MIFDSLIEMDRYIPALPQLQAVRTLLGSGVLETAEPGFHTTDIPGVRYNILDYTTTPLGKALEIHTKEADVQIVLQGKELAVCAPREMADFSGPYDENKDARFVECTSVSSFHLLPGKFLILFPGEPHLGNGLLDEPTKCRKVVFKLML